MEMNKIALLGAGAIGAYFIWGFQKNMVRILLKFNVGKENVPVWQE